MTTRRNFLKGAGLVGAGTIAAVDPMKLLQPSTKEGGYELANFRDGTLKRDYLSGQWSLLFSSLNSFNPSGIKNLIVEIAGRKFELSHPTQIEVTETKKARLFYYEVKGKSWVELND